ncbi:uncharacterized protein LOC110599602 isoform X1 [Manihot esculenta]|uniref:Protein kinase domain-containing protein n=1 Tax=Manihot esculenta TaxID=3983 RepID=A0A2C9UL51_MANES|nr:uncharacterized protein LOC110599602 isoform X1 [Manihot esculenta]OAY31767.1 hypothetical protein MANES_14G138500v8 [Manihot esculenta]
MAFDQNHIPKDLRPLTVARTISEEPRIAAASIAAAPSIATTSATSRSPEIFANPDGSIPVFYPMTVSDAGFVGLGYGNPAPWAPRLPVPIGSGNSASVGFGYSPNLGNRVVGNAVDHAAHDVVGGSGSSPHLNNMVNSNGGNELTSLGFGYNPNLGNRGSGSGTGVDHVSEEGGDDSVSGKKVKFLCSFGGKILPRPSDGMLRYVGGQTRIISVRRDVTFNELVQKMVDAYGQPVIIKYQLPDEDLDALVSVSCPDDLDNMMDEYEKLVERSSDGSGKLRVFLFSATELEAAGTVQFGDLHDSGQRYVDAVNGIADGVGCAFAWKESIASATSTQNSDFSGTEAVDSSGTGQVDVSGAPTTSLLSPRGDLASPHDSSPKFVPVEPNPPVYADASAVSLGIPTVKSGPPQTLSSQPEVEIERSIPVAVPQQQLGYDFQKMGMGIPPPASHLQAYVEPHQEITNHADYMYLPAQMRFPNAQLLGTAGSVFTQQQIRDSNASVASHQYIPAAHMTMSPTSSHVAMRPTIVQPLVQPQQARVERFSDENMHGTRIVQFPDPGYNAYQLQHPPAIVGGGYCWHPVAQTEHVVFSDGSVPHQQVIIPEKIQRLEDCFMCQKQLPHAHSDPLAQDQREGGISNLSHSNSLNHSLHLGDTMKGQPLSWSMVGGGLGDGTIEQGVGARSSALSHVDHQVGLQQSEAIVFSHNENERTTMRKADDSDQSQISVPHGMMAVPGFQGIVLQSRPEGSVQQHQVSGQYQVKEETLQIKPSNGNFSNFPGVIQASERSGHECPVEYSGSMHRDVSKEDIIDSCVSYDQRRSVEEMLETLHINPEINNDQNKSHVDNLWKEDILDHRTQQLGGRDAFLDDSYKKHQVVPDSNHVKPTDLLPASVVTQQPVYGNQVSYPQSNIGIHLLDSGEVSYGNPTFQVVQPAYAIDRILQPKISPTDVGPGAQNANVPSSLASSGRVSDFQDSPNSLFSSQDPWNLRHDAHLPPPRPNKILTKKEAFDTKDPFSENLANNPVEIITDGLMGDGVPQPLSNSKKDLNLEQAQSSKGSAEELIKQELQAVAEGVVASVFQSGNHSPDSMVYERNESAYEASQDMKISSEDIEVQHKAKFEDMKNKLPEKLNFRFPVSEGNYRLQIIKNIDLEELRELGSGTFGTVYHGKWRGTDVAIKRINDRCFAGKPSEQERMIDDFWNEAIKLADLHHPNVVAFYGVVLDGPGGSVATVTEYMVNGSLRNALQKNERSLDKRKRLLIAMDVAFGMEYLHGKNIVHFDLKSDNLLVNLRDPHRPICKVGDLGLSKVKCQTLISGGVRGTLPWMAPELLNGSSSLVSEKVDVFSFGIVLWELLTGEEPYADLHYGAIIGGIVSNTLRPPVPESCDPEWKSLMERCWASEPSDRPNFTEIANILRAMAAKVPPKGYNPTQQHPST